MISSYNLATDAPISTPGGVNQFRFRGVSDDTNDIYGLRFGGSYLLAAGTPTGVIGGVPEPGAWALMITGFGMAGSILRRRRRLTAG